MIAFGNPENPKRQEMEMMLQFLTTMEDLTMFAKKYESDLGDLAKIQVEMQFKSLNSWKRKTTGLRVSPQATRQLLAISRPSLRDCL